MNQETATVTLLRNKLSKQIWLNQQSSNEDNFKKLNIIFAVTSVQTNTRARLSRIFIEWGTRAARATGKAWVHCGTRTKD